jgi:hypothetical protein
MAGEGSTPPLAVVIPTLNEAAHLPLLLADLAVAKGLVAELVVVDGGSSDGTATCARLAGARLVVAAGGRAPSWPWAPAKPAPPGFCFSMATPACRRAGRLP